MKLTEIWLLEVPLKYFLQKKLHLRLSIFADSKIFLRQPETQSKIWLAHCCFLMLKKR